MATEEELMDDVWIRRVAAWNGPVADMVPATGKEDTECVSW